MGRDSVVGILIRTGWTVRESYPNAGKTFHTHPDRPWGPPTLLNNGYRVSSPGVKRLGSGVDQLAPRLKKSRAKPLLLHWDFVAYSRVKLSAQTLTRSIYEEGGKLPKFWQQLSTCLLLNPTIKTSNPVIFSKSSRPAKWLSQTASLRHYENIS